MAITLTHPAVNTFVDKLTNIYSNLQELINAISETSKEFESEADQKKFKGDMFEVFGQYFIKYFVKSLGITEFEPNLDNDYGVDAGSSAVCNGMPAAIQFKFRSDPKSILLYGKLSTFFAQGLGKYKASVENLILVSTTIDTDYKIEEALGGHIRHINKDQISLLTDSKHTNFWKDFHEDIRQAHINPVNRTKLPGLWEHQGKCIEEKIKPFINCQEDMRGQVIIPTGGGKTRIESESINLSIHNGGLIHIVMAPRIVLVNQILNHCWDHKDTDWGKLLVRSGQDERLKFYSDEEYDDAEVMATTSAEDILQAISDAIYNHTPIIIFSTYHSADAIGKALHIIGINADLVIGDEAHNMTTEGFNELLDPEIIPAHKWLFFTATRRLGKRLGMDNTDRFGDILYQIQPSILVTDKIIVPPRMHILHHKDSASDALFVVSAIIKHLKEFSPNEFRMIIACKGVQEAHNKRGVHTLAAELREQKELNNFFISAISSNTELMKGEIAALNIKNISTARKEIFDRYMNSKYAMILHYDILSEGIDLPGTTAVMPLRSLSPLRAVQFIGRSLRIIGSDRDKLKSKIIKPGDTKGWAKPFGWIIVPDDVTGNYRDNILSLINSMRRAEFDIDVEYTSEDGDKSISIDSKNDIQDLFESLPASAKEFVSNVYKNISKIDHEIESEEIALIKASDQTVLEFAKWIEN